MVAGGGSAELGTENSGAAQAGGLRSRAQMVNLDSQNSGKDRPVKGRWLLLKGKVKSAIQVHLQVTCLYIVISCVSDFVGSVKMY